MSHSIIGRIKFILSLILLSHLLTNNQNVFAKEFRLRCNDKKFPITINFPNKPKCIEMHEPSLNLDMYYFIYSDKNSSIAYGAAISTMPEYRELSKNEAQNVIETAINAQIKSTDKILGTKGEILESNTKPINSNPSKYIKIIRDLVPKLYGIYRTTLFDKYLFTVYANGLKTEENCIKINNFIESLTMHNNKR